MYQGGLLLDSSDHPSSHHARHASHPHPQIYCAGRRNRDSHPRDRRRREIRRGRDRVKSQTRNREGQGRLEKKLIVFKIKEENLATAINSRIVEQESQPNHHHPWSCRSNPPPFPFDPTLSTHPSPRALHQSSLPPFRYLPKWLRLDHHYACASTH